MDYRHVHYIDAIDLDSALQACTDMENSNGVNKTSVKGFTKELASFKDLVFHIDETGSLFVWGVQVFSLFNIDRI